MAQKNSKKIMAIQPAIRADSMKKQMTIWTGAAIACAAILLIINQDYAAHRADRTCDLAAVDPAYMDQCSAAIRGTQ